MTTTRSHPRTKPTARPPGHSVRPPGPAARVPGGAYLLLLLAAVMWGFVAVLYKLAARDGVSPLGFAFWRAAIGGGLFLAYHLVRAGRRVGTGATTRAAGSAQPRAGVVRGFLRAHAPLLALAALVSVVHYASFASAAQRGSASFAALVLAFVPALVVVLARPVLHERLTRGEWRWVCVSVAGLTVLALARDAGPEVTLAALGWGLLACVSGAAKRICDKSLLAGLGPATINAVVLPVGALLLLPWADLGTRSAGAWAALAAAGVGSTFGGNLLYFLGLRHVPASHAALIVALDPLVGAGAAALVLGERLGALGLLAAALLGAAAAGIAVRRGRAEVAHPRSRRERFGRRDRVPAGLEALRGPWARLAARRLPHREREEPLQDVGVHREHAPGD